MIAKIRLEQIKQEDKKNSVDKMIFLLNPKDTKILQSLVAWKNIKTTWNPEQNVLENCDIKFLWELTEINIRDYAITLGCTVQQALLRLKQLRNLSLIYPDGTINQTARILVNNYIKNKINELTGRKEE